MMLRYLRNLVCPPAPSALPILNEIDAGDLRMTSFVFGGEYGVERAYDVTIKVERGGLSIVATGQGRTFDEALTAAWAKWPAPAPEQRRAAS